MLRTYKGACHVYLEWQQGIGEVQRQPPLELLGIDDIAASGVRGVLGREGWACPRLRTRCAHSRRRRRGHGGAQAGRRLRLRQMARSSGLDSNPWWSMLGNK